MSNNNTSREVDCLRNAQFDKTEDAELTELFSAFDEVTTPDALKESTFEAIVSQNAPAAAGAATPEHQADASSTPKRQASARLRSKWRAFRIAAVAACLAFALTGGAAYAIPSSHVSIGQDGSSVELGVNVFGITVTADSNDEEGREIIEATDLLHKPFEESLALTYESIEQRHPDEEIRIGIDPGIGDQHQRLEEKSTTFVNTHRTERETAPENEPDPQEPNQQPVEGAPPAPDNDRTQPQPEGQGGFDEQPQQAEQPQPQDQSQQENPDQRAWQGQPADNAPSHREGQ